MSNLKRIREEANISQKELAKVLGITQQGYSFIEQGKANPSLSTARKIALFFNKSIEEIFFEVKN
ncbi:MAG: helix-turn-helix transcriptional regulator [Fusobacterium sp.]|nr:helix-turn-helix transcriptional regulator [Fusobacterium sp.]